MPQNLIVVRELSPDSNTVEYLSYGQDQDRMAEFMGYMGSLTFGLSIDKALPIDTEKDQFESQVHDKGSYDRGKELLQPGLAAHASDVILGNLIEDWENSRARSREQLVHELGLTALAHEFAVHNDFLLADYRGIISDDDFQPQLLEDGVEGPAAIIAARLKLPAAALRVDLRPGAQDRYSHPEEQLHYSLGEMTDNGLYVEHAVVYTYGEIQKIDLE